jgi:hypothetical protein
MVPALRAQDLGKNRQKPSVLRHGDESQVALGGYERPLVATFCAYQTE